MASFIKSAAGKEGWINDERTEICFCGRSNVGKSSLINAIAKEKIAITSSMPGRTQLVNFYDFDKFRLIDLPGYGFANVSKDKVYHISKLLNEYLEERTNLFGIFQICDISVFTESDKTMAQYFSGKFKNFFILLNKIDKIKEKDINKKIIEASKMFSVPIENVIPISVKDNINLNKVYAQIKLLIK